MSSARRQQRSEWKDFLDALPFFDDITVVTEDKEDIQSDYDMALGPATVKDGKSGIIVILLSVAMRAVTRDAEAGPVVEFLHVAHVIENVSANRSAETNGTLKTREEVTEKIISYTHCQFRPTNGRGPFMLADSDIKIGDDSGHPSEDCHFETPASLGVLLEQCELPVIANDDGTLTITCATPGAALFYTLDGRKPNPGSGTLYLAPITPDPGTVVKARAWLAGRLASEIATLTL